MEEVCVYNQYGNRTNRVVTREYAKDNNLWIKGVAVAIVNSKNEVLLSKRAEGRTNAGAWEMCGGHVIAGESSSGAITREIEEELGLKRKGELTLLDKDFKGKDSSAHYLVDRYMLMQDVDISKLKLQEEEVSEVKFVNIDDVKEIAMGGYNFDEEEVEQILGLIKRQISKNNEMGER